MTTTRIGYVPQGRWDGSEEFFDFGEWLLYPTDTTAYGYIREVMEYRLSHPRPGQRILAETRVVKRTIIDEVVDQ